MVEGILCQHKEIPGRWPDPETLLTQGDSEEWLRLDADLSDDDRAREVDRAVEMLDLQPLFGLYFGVGRKACRPDLLLKVELYELGMGRQSPAEWHLDMRLNVAVRWLAMGMKASRAALYAFRDRCGPFLEQANQQILQMGLEAGVTEATRGSLDGSTIAACATRRHFAKESALKERSLALNEALQSDQSGEPIEARPSWMAPTPVGRIRQWWRFGRVGKMLARRQRENELRPSKRKPREKVMVSWSDPEAALGLDKHSIYRPLYNVQVIQDLDSPLVLAYDVFAQQNDMGTLTPMLERVTDLVGHKPKQLLADSGYLSVRDVENCELAGVELYAPWQENDYSEKSKNAKPITQIPKSAFTWEPDQHAYRCPEGHQLPFTKTTTQKRTEGQEVLTMEFFTCPYYATAMELCRAD